MMRFFRIEKKWWIAACATLLAAPALGCGMDNPMKPKADILALMSKDRKTLTKQEQAAVTEYKAADKKYWELANKVEPVCTDGYPTSCTVACKGQPAKLLKKANMVEGELHYYYPPEKREEISEEMKKLQEKWADPE